MARVLITDVTRMQRPNVCVAGLRGTTLVRLNDPAPTEDLLKKLDGLKPGDLVEVDWKPSNRVTPPHLEDGTWDADKIRKVGSETYADFRSALGREPVDRLTAAFGKIYLKGSGGNCAFRPSTGARSIVTLDARNVRAYIDFDKIRVSFDDSERSWRKVALEDLTVRLHEVGCSFCRRNMIRYLEPDFNADRALLRIGLSRPRALGGHPDACWVQVNGIYPPQNRRHFR